MKLQDKYVVFGDNSCLAICYIYAVLHYTADRVEQANLYYLETMVDTCLLQAFNNGLLDEECKVLDADKLITTINPNVKVRVEKMKITTLQDLPSEGYAAVNYSFNGKNHWVLFKDRMELYNSLENSVCRKYGSPTDARVINFE